MKENLEIPGSTPSFIVQIKEQEVNRLKYVPEPTVVY